jgi:hypothetical protein
MMNIQLENKSIVRLRNGDIVDPLYEEWGGFNNGFHLEGSPYQHVMWRVDGVCVSRPGGDPSEFDVVEVLGIKPPKPEAEDTSA